MRGARRYTRGLSLVAALALVLAACGGTENEDATGAEEEAGTDDAEDPDADDADEGAADGDAEGETVDAAGWEPDGDVEFIIPFGPGGGFDAYSRQVVEAAQQFLPDGVRIEVANVEGAGGAVGAQTLRRADPDGLTIGLVYDVGLAVAQTIDDAAEIQLNEDFSWIAGITQEPYTLFATADSGITSIEELGGQELRFGALGAASPMFVVGVILGETLGFDNQWVTAYGGAGDLLSGATRGDIDLSALEVSSIAQYVEAGDLVPLLVLGEEPSAVFPDVPTVQDVDGLDSPVLSMRPIGAPAGVPQEALDYWEDIFLQAMATEELAAWSEESGRTVAASDAAETQQRVDGAIELMAGFGDQVREQYELVAE